MTARATSLLAALIGIAVPLSALAQFDAPYYWRDWPGWSMTFGSVWGTFWWVMPLLMMAFMVGVCFVIMKGMFASRARHRYHRSGLRILGERFAKGEISKEEYDEKRKLLEET